MGKRTVDGKRIRHTYLFAEGTCPANDEVLDALIEAHTWQDDIRLVGWTISDEIILPANASMADKDRVRIAAFLSRGAGQDYDARFDVIHCTQRTQIETGGMMTNERLADHDTVMFPEGYGIDFDTGEAIYLYETIRNDTGQIISTRPTCILYYVER